MSDSKKTASGVKTGAVSGSAVNGRGNTLFLRFKDPLLLLGWITVFILIAGLSWHFTQPMRNRLMLNSVNRVLEQSGEDRKLGKPLDSAGEQFGSLLMGSWFSVIDPAQSGFPETGGQPGEANAYVFAFIAGGTIFPCAAIITPDGKAEEFIPLNSHGEKVLKQLSPEVLGIYARRIEGIKQ